MNDYGQDVVEALERADKRKKNKRWYTTSEVKGLVPGHNPNKMCYTLNRLHYKGKLEKNVAKEVEWKLVDN